MLVSRQACTHCGRDVPVLHPTGEAWQGVFRSLKSGSRTMAVAELTSLGIAARHDAEAFLNHLDNCVCSWPLNEDARWVVAQSDSAFANVTKPAHFTDFEHCDECRQHDDTLRAKTRFTVTRDDLGNLGWDPLLCSSPQGIGYYLPALARYAVLPNLWPRRDEFPLLLLGLLDSQTGEAFRYWCDDSQRRAVASLINYLEQIPRFACAATRAAASWLDGK